MSEDHKITCDGCGADLTYTGNSVDYRLALCNERKPIRPGIGVVTDMAIYPKIERNAHFCNIGCLKGWLRTNYPDQPNAAQEVKRWNRLSSEWGRPYRTSPSSTVMGGKPYLPR